MATRMYMSLHEQTGVTVALPAAWDSAKAAVGILRPEPRGRGGYIASLVAKTVVTNPYDLHLAQFISDPLPAAGTLSGTFRVANLMRHSGGGAANSFQQITIQVVSNDGSVIRGVAFSGQTQITYSSATTDPNLFLTDSVANRVMTLAGSLALTPVAYSANDRIVVDVGARFVDASTTTSAELLVSDREDAYSDNPHLQKFFTSIYQKADLAVSDTIRPWIEFSQDLYTVTLNAEEFRYTLTGQLLNGPVTANTPFVDIESIEGLDSTEPRMSSVNRESMHGGYVSSEYEGIRTVTLSGTVYAPPTLLDTYLNTLKQNFEPSRRDRPLFFGADSGISPSLFVLGKSQGIRYGKSRDRSVGKVPFQVQIVCQDPRIYLGSAFTPTQQVITTGPTTFTVGGNRDTNARIDLTLTPTAAASAVDPEFKLTNKYGVFNIKWSGTVTFSVIITIDLNARSVLRDFSVNARTASTITLGNWIPLSEGSNTISTARASGDAIVATVNYRQAWR